MTERSATVLIVSVVSAGLVWALAMPPEHRAVSNTKDAPALSPDTVPLVTGEEPIKVIFTKAGCPVCHAIPGIPGADGRVGPPLFIGTTGPDRLRDPTYRGRAGTVHDYVIESVLEPGLFVAPGYPAGTMPTWYGARLSALALEKIAAYLEQQRGPSPP